MGSQTSRMSSATAAGLNNALAQQKHIATEETDLVWKHIADFAEEGRLFCKHLDTLRGHIRTAVDLLRYIKNDSNEERKRTLETRLRTFLGKCLRIDETALSKKGFLLARRTHKDSIDWNRAPDRVEFEDSTQKVRSRDCQELLKRHDVKRWETRATTLASAAEQSKELHLKLCCDGEKVQAMSTTFCPCVTVRRIHLRVLLSSLMQSLLTG